MHVAMGWRKVGYHRAGLFSFSLVAKIIKLCLVGTELGDLIYLHADMIIAICTHAHAHTELAS